MKQSAIVVLLLLIAVSARADLTGAVVSGGPEVSTAPWSLVDCEFLVENGSTDEAIATVVIELEAVGGFWFYSGLGYDEIEQGRPNWELGSGTGGAHFLDADGGLGEVFPGESTRIWVGITPDDELEPGIYPIGYYITGDGTGEPPHFVWGATGYIHLVGASPVEGTTWGRVKALYR